MELNYLEKQIILLALCQNIYDLKKFIKSLPKEEKSDKIFWKGELKEIQILLKKIKKERGF